MLIDCHALKDGSTYSHKMATPSPLSTPSHPGLAQGTGKPQMAAAQPPRAAQGSGNQGQPRLAPPAVAAAVEVCWGITFP